MDENIYKEYVTFKVGREYYALNIQYVQKIENTKRIRPVPNTREEEKGIMDFQGEQIVPIVDLRVLFNIDSVEKSSHIIVTKVNDVWVGFLVDKADEVIEIEEKDISIDNLSEIIATESNHYIKGIYRKKAQEQKDKTESEQKENEKLLIILNPEKLIERKTA